MISAKSQWIAVNGRCRQFTLIELLVVVTVILILISMLMPALNLARQAGQGSLCQSNLRMLGLGVQFYADDYDDRVPWSWSGYTDCLYFGYCSWTGPYAYGAMNAGTLVWPYINDINIYDCPGYLPDCPMGETVTPSYAEIVGIPVVWNSNYHWNPYLGASGYGPAGDNGSGGNLWAIGNAAGLASNLLRLSRLTSAADTIFAYDRLRSGSPYGSSPQHANLVAGGYGWLDTLGDGDRSNFLNYGPLPGNPSGVPYWGSPNMAAWHNNGTNVCFLDGHVERCPWDSEKTFYDLEDVYWRP